MATMEPHYRLCRQAAARRALSGRGAGASSPRLERVYIETTRRFAHHGYLAICAQPLMERAGDGDPDDVAAKVLEGGVPPTATPTPRCSGAPCTPQHNGKVGPLRFLFGGGRHAFLHATQPTLTPAPSQGGRVLMSKEELNGKTLLAPIHLSKDLSCPALIGISGSRPSPEQVNQHEAELMKHGKSYKFHPTPGHGLLSLAPATLPTPAGHGCLAERF